MSYEHLDHPHDCKSIRKHLLGYVGIISEQYLPNSVHLTPKLEQFVGKYALKSDQIISDESKNIEILVYMI